MSSKKFSLVRGRRIRVTKVDACGRPVYGDDSQAVSKGFISVGFTANMTNSDEVNQTNASGESCIYEPSEPSLRGYGVEIQFCEVDPELFSLVTGQEVYLDANGDAIGLSIGTDIEVSDQAFALELWAGSPAVDACVDPNAQGTFGYLLMPYLKGGVVGDFSVTNGAVTFTITGATTRDGNAWGRGPYNMMLSAGVPAPLVTALHPKKHVLMILVDVAPPEIFTGARPLLDPDSTPITAIVATEGGSPSEADFVFTGASTAPVWIDFGDDEWDYVAPGTAGSSHTYAANGTYTVTASSNGTFITASVVIPFP